jgi:PEP-CTERM motif
MMNFTTGLDRGRLTGAACGLVALAALSVPSPALAVSYFYDGIGGFLQGTLTGGHFNGTNAVVTNATATAQINQSAGVVPPSPSQTSGVFGTRDNRLPPNLALNNGDDAWSQVRWGLPQCGGINGAGAACAGPNGGQSGLEIISQTGQVGSVIKNSANDTNGLGFVQTFAGVHYNRPIWFTTGGQPVTTQPILTGGTILAGIALYRDEAKTQLVFNGLSLFPFEFNESLNVAPCPSTGLYAGHTHATTCDDAIQLSNLGLVGEFFDPLVNKFIGFQVLGFFSSPCAGLPTPPNPSADDCPATTTPPNGGVFYSSENGDSSAYVRFRLLESDTPLLPEPATLAVFGSALAGLAYAVRRRRRA